MINLFALCLIVSSLTAAGLWSPSPAVHPQDPDQDIIVKGHRVVVVEYDDHGRHNTKVSISPEPEPDASQNGNPSLDDHSEGSASDRHRNRDLICDALGKCKHKIASAMEKAKVLVSESVQDARDIGEAVTNTFDKAKETVSDKSHDVETWVSEKAHGVKESVEKANEKLSTQRAKESLEKTKEIVSEKTRDMKDHAKETLKEAIDRGKRVGECAEKEAVDKIKTGGNELKEKGYRRLSDRGVKLVKDAVWFLRPAESLKAAMDVLSLLGFALALGMGVWITFISSYVLANVMPRQQLAVVQSKMYAVYFRAMACSVGMALLGYLFNHTRWMFSTTAEIFQGNILLAALVMIFANSLYMEPRATKIMFERLKLEKEEGRGIEDVTTESRQVTDAPGETTTTTTTSTTTTTTPAEFMEREVVKSRIVGLNQRLKKLNTYSSLLNLLTLMALTWHLVYLSQRLGISR